VTAPLLVFGWGNPSRGDDALGPLFVARLRDALGPEDAARVEFLEDFQLQIEHALDLVGREQVLFVDASIDGPRPFEASTLEAAADTGFSTHALAPQAVLHVFRTLHGRSAPPCTLLAIRGESFGLGEPLGAEAGRHLEQALAWGRRWIETH
jgi:hydrogenase maturation protease